MPLALVLVAASPAPAEATGIELTTPVRQSFWRLQDAWQRWTSGYYQDDRDLGEAAVEELLAIAEHLGMARLPDLSGAAAGYAVSSARAGNFPRARWALEDARRLDPGLPGTEFARATVLREEGRYGAAAAATVRGYLRLLELPQGRRLWLHNAFLWLMTALLLAGSLFVALQMAVKGRVLLEDLVGVVARPLHGAAAWIAVAAVLLWPVALPGGVVWLALYWSVLLWTYLSISERVVTALLWLLLGVTPLLLAAEQRRLQVVLGPPLRVVEQVAADRLYGTLFSDLRVLRSVLPESLAATAVAADLHRRFGQWEHASALYRDLTEARPSDPASFINLGVYYHRKKDFGAAINYFRTATEVDPTSAEAFFNLSQAYSQSYAFGDSHQALARARELGGGRVDAWLSEEGASEGLTIVSAGEDEARAIREELLAGWRPQRASTLVEFWRRHLSLSVAIGAVLLAVSWPLLLRQLGGGAESASPPRPPPWVRVLVPGLVSAVNRRGGRAFVGVLLPVGLVLILLSRSLFLRAPVGYDPGVWLTATAGLLGLAVVAAARASRELRG